MGNDYYVYVYTDPSQKGRFIINEKLVLLEKPIYVGKGKGDRHLHGIKNLLTEYNHRFYNKLRKLSKRYTNLHPIKIEQNLSNKEAIQIESDIILNFGRLNYDAGGILLNIALGGETPDTTGVAASNKGKKYEDYLSEDRIHEIKTKLRITPKNTAQMVKTRKQNGSYTTGKNHPRAKTFTIISSAGDLYHVNGQLKVFCEEHNLSWQTLFNNKNRGPIQIDRSRYKNLKRLTPRFFNTIGWSLSTTP